MTVVTKTVPTKKTRTRKAKTAQTPPEGVTVVGLNDAQRLHDVIAGAVGEPQVVNPDDVNRDEGIPEEHPTVQLTTDEEPTDEQSPEQPAIEPDLNVEKFPVDPDDILTVDLGRVRQTKQYLVAEIDGKQRWFDKAKFVSWVVDADGTAHVTLDRRQVRAWKLTSVA